MKLNSLYQDVLKVMNPVNSIYKYTQSYWNDRTKFDSKSVFEVSESNVKSIEQRLQKRWILIDSFKFQTCFDSI